MYHFRMVPRDRPDRAVIVSTSDSSLTLAIASHLACSPIDVHRDGLYAFTLVRFGKRQPFWAITGSGHPATQAALSC